MAHVTIVTVIDAVHKGTPGKRERERESGRCYTCDPTC